RWRGLEGIAGATGFEERLMQYAFLLAVILFSLKIAWNLTLPYLLARRARSPEEASRGISPMPGLEIVLLLLGVGLSWAGGLEPPWSPTRAAVYGAVLILFSYAHLVVASAVVGLLRNRRRRG